MKSLFVFLFTAFIALAVFAVSSQINALNTQPSEIKELVVLNYTLPRIAVAFLSGGFLALATTLMAQITQNPLASDSTLGVGSGAGFFLLAGALFFPNLGFNSVFNSFIGATAALFILFLISLGRGFSVFTTTLSGLIIGLFFGSLTTLLMLFFQEESFFLAVWMSGDLAQDGVYNLLMMMAYFIPALIMIGYFSRSFHLFMLGDSACKSLGVNVNLLRIIGLLIAAYLTAVVVAYVGIIGFIGLGAYTVIDRFKFRNFGIKLISAFLCGGLILGVTDEILIIILNLSGINLPAGGISAFLGAPLLLWLVFYSIKQGESAAKSEDKTPAKPVSKFILPTLGVSLIAICLVSLFFGSYDFVFDIFSVRISRVIAALTSGAMLGVIGVILQRLSQNDMASPELLGINSGVSLGVLAAIFTMPAMSIIFGVIGACIMLGFMVAINYKSKMLPQKVILTGIAIMAFVSSIEKILLATGDSRIYNFISYSSGSTYSVTLSWALAMIAVAIFALGAALFYSREISILTLGEASASSIGVDTTKYRIILFLICAFVSAIATLSIGPISFVGLLAPHIASFLGFYRIHLHIISALLIGGILMVTADFIGRTLISPYEIPSGLVATIIGSIYFVIMTRRLK